MLARILVLPGGAVGEDLGHGGPGEDAGGGGLQAAVGKAEERVAAVGPEGCHE